MVGVDTVSDACSLEQRKEGLEDGCLWLWDTIASIMERGGKV